MHYIAFNPRQPLEAADSLSDAEAAMPVPGPRDLLVAVRAAGVNPLDLKVRAGLVGVPDAVQSLGWDSAGIVTAVGSEVQWFEPGQAVYYAGSFDRSGAFAQYHLVDERLAGRMPAGLDFAQAAALPLAALTAWQLLFERFALEPGKWTAQGSLLVLGGAGGVGSLLLQLARQLTGLTVIATASRPDSAAWCSDMGAHHVIDHGRPLLPQLAALGLAPVTHVAALSHTAQHMPALVELMAPHGKLGVIDDHAHFDAAPLKSKSISLHWEMVFTRPLHGTPDMQAQQHILGKVARLLEHGVLRTTLQRRIDGISAAALRSALQDLEQGGAVGKTVLVAQ